MNGDAVIPSGSMSPNRERVVLPPTTADNVQHDSWLRWKGAATAIATMKSDTLLYC